MKKLKSNQEPIKKDELVLEIFIILILIINTFKIFVILNVNILMPSHRFFLTT